jgi:DNA replication protein DnaC
MRGLILKNILSEYDAIRRTELKALRQREQEVMEAIPEITDIRRTIIEMMAKRSRDIIQNPHNAAQSTTDLENKIKELKIKEKELLLQHGLPESYLSVKYHCPRCKDTGYVGSPIKEKCVCLTQKLLERTYHVLWW